MANKIWENRGATAEEVSALSDFDPQRQDFCADDILEAFRLGYKHGHSDGYSDGYIVCESKDGAQP